MPPEDDPPEEAGEGRGAGGPSDASGEGPGDGPMDPMYVVTSPPGGAPVIRPVWGRERERATRGAPLEVFASRDLELENELAIVEAERRRADAEQDRPIGGVVYTPRPDVPRRRLAVLVIVVAVIVVAVWFWGVPRNDAELVVQYNEGVLGGINVDARVENHGTRSLDALVITISVQDSSDTPVTESYTWTGSVAPHSRAGVDAVSFQGDQWETYHIFVSWEYDSDGRHYQGSDYLSTEGDAMNVWFSVEMD
jgi:hypothetical protein